MSRKPQQPARETFERANPPGLYRCPHCGDVLSGPARLYQCPARPGEPPEAEQQ